MKIANVADLGWRMRQEEAKLGQLFSKRLHEDGDGMTKLECKLTYLYIYIYPKSINPVGYHALFGVVVFLGRKERIESDDEPHPSFGI